MANNFDQSKWRKWSQLLDRVYKEALYDLRSLPRKGPVPDGDIIYVVDYTTDCLFYEKDRTTEALHKYVVEWNQSTDAVWMDFTGYGLNITWIQVRLQLNGIARSRVRFIQRSEQETLPTFLQEQLALLRMCGYQETLPDVGVKFRDDTFLLFVPADYLPDGSQLGVVASHTTHLNHCTDQGVSNGSSR